MTNSWEDRVYSAYYETHILPRKGPVTMARLRSMANSFEHHFSEYLPEDHSAPILDVGCGSGALVWWLQQKGYSGACGIDLSESQLNVGRALGIGPLHGEPLAAHLERVGQGAYALVFLRDVLEHLDKAAVLEFLDLIRLALCPGGALVLQLPNGSSPFFGRIRYGDFSHQGAFTASSLSQLMRLTGFDTPECKGFEPRPVRMTPWKRCFTSQGRRISWRELSWAFVKRFYGFLLFAESGTADHIVTFNLICSARRKD